MKLETTSVFFRANGQMNLMNNYVLAKVQLRSPQTRLESYSNLKEQCCKSILDVLSKIYIADIWKSTCFKAYQPSQWFSPRHIMFHLHECGKVRQFFYAAVFFLDHLLNNVLVTGPDSQQRLIHVLLRFQKQPHVVSADIKWLLLQIRVLTKDQPPLRFLLWREDPITEGDFFQYARHFHGWNISPTFDNDALRRTASENQSEC